MAFGLGLCAIGGRCSRGATGPKKEVADIRQVSVPDDNQDDFDAVQDVFTRCYSSFQYLSTPRSFERWQVVFQEMSGYGARRQTSRSTGFCNIFSAINANASPIDELGATLQLDEATRRSWKRADGKRSSPVLTIWRRCRESTGILTKLASNLPVRLMPRRHDSPVFGETAGPLGRRRRFPRGNKFFKLLASRAGSNYGPTAWTRKEIAAHVA